MYIFYSWRIGHKEYRRFMTCDSSEGHCQEHNIYVCIYIYSPYILCIYICICLHRYLHFPIVPGFEGDRDIEADGQAER